MARLNKRRQEELEPKRFQNAWESILAYGYSVNCVNDPKVIEFTFKGENVKFYPYTGWATGKSIKDGRGLQNLLKQIK